MSFKIDTARVLTVALLLACCAAPRAAAQTSAGEGATNEQSFPRTKLENVEFEFEGNEAFATESLVDWAKRCVARRATSPGWFSLSALETCLRKDTRLWLAGFGRVRAKFGKPLVTEAWPGLRVRVPVEDGARYRFGEMRVEGTKFFTAERLLATLPLKRGDFAYNTALKTWLTKSVKYDYENNGFLQFAYEVKPQFADDPETPGDGIVDYDVTITEGPRFVLRGVEFVGDVGTPHERLRRMIRIRDGEFFNSREFLDGLNEIDSVEGVNFDRKEDVVYRKSVTDAETADIFVVISLQGEAARWH